MTAPASGETFTNEQAMAIGDWRFPETTVWRINNNWHQGPDGGGAFEPRAIQWGYPEGFPVYAGIEVGDGQTFWKYHVYWRPDLGGPWLDYGD